MTPPAGHTSELESLSEAIRGDQELILSRTREISERSGNVSRISERAAGEIEALQTAIRRFVT